MDHPKPRLRYIPDRFGRINQGHWVEERDPFGRVPEISEVETFDLSDIYRLKGRITGQGKLDRNDVAKIEVLLDLAGVFDISETDGPTGYYGMRLEQGLKRFQKQQGVTVDGKLDPNGETLKSLKTYLGDSGEVRSTAQVLQKMGRNGDKVLAHLSPEEARLLHRTTDGGSINPKTGLLEFFEEVDDFSSMPDNDWSAPEPQSNSDSGISEAINNAYNKGSPGGSHNNASGPEYDTSVNVSRPLSGFGGGSSRPSINLFDDEKPVDEKKAMAETRAQRNRAFKVRYDDDEGKLGNRGGRKSLGDGLLAPADHPYVDTFATWDDQVRKRAEEEEATVVKEAPKKAPAPSKKKPNPPVQSVQYLKPPYGKENPPITKAPYTSWDDYNAISIPPIQPDKVDLFKFRAQQIARIHVANALTRKPNMTQSVVNALMAIYDREGGMKQHKGSETYGGITQKTLTSLIKGDFIPGVEEDAVPSDLTVGQIADAYAGYFDMNFARPPAQKGGTFVKGVEALESIQSEKVRNALSDAIFSHGPKAGITAMQRAINTVDKKNIEVDGIMGSETWQPFDALTQDEKTVDELLNAFADERVNLVNADKKIPDNEKKGWKARIDELKPQ